MIFFCALDLPKRFPFAKQAQPTRAGGSGKARIIGRGVSPAAPQQAETHDRSLANDGEVEVAGSALLWRRVFALDCPVHFGERFGQQSPHMPLLRRCQL